MSLVKTYPRVWSLENGIAMVVTDLHGDWDAYERYRNHFTRLHTNGLVDYLIFTGDLIHAEDPENDASLEILLDVLALRASYGDCIIYICGNHELPHIYAISLSRGDRAYTPEFEKVLSQSRWRKQVIDLFSSLPFYIRSRAGVSVTHAGAPAVITEPDNVIKLFAWDHQAVLNWAELQLKQGNIVALRRGFSNLHHGLPYDTLAKYFLDVAGPQDPRYDDLLRGFFASNHPDFNPLLWSTLFTRCEEEYGLSDHGIFVEALLQELSVDFVPQRFLVTGHMTIKGGHQAVTPQHLRLASARHASPRTAGEYLLFDTSQPVNNIKELSKGLGSVFK
ncbi:MAG TPA: metallophosphoesterase family protein [Anaerolineae bacterium]|nr:metallophosphoesterase family protein [Anaerolineae bacterium]